MKSIVTERAKYVLVNSWLGWLLPAGLHQLLNPSRRAMATDRVRITHPAEYRISRNPGSKARP